MWSYVLTAVGVVGLLMAGRKNMWGWMVCIASQVLWAIYAVVTNQLGFLIAAVIYTGVYGRNFVAWWKEKHAVPTEGATGSEGASVPSQTSGTHHELNGVVVLAQGPDSAP